MNPAVVKYIVMKFIYTLYSILYNLALITILPQQYLKRPAPARRRWLVERLGFIPSSPPEGDRRRVWIHAVSVGEAIAAKPIVTSLGRYHRIFITTVTDTGQAVVRDYLSGDQALFYAPFDSRGSLRRFIQTLRPDMIILMETEIWPNLVRQANEDEIPVIIVNGRLSDHSYKNYRLIRFFMKDILSRIRAFCMQTRRDAEKIISLGADPERVFVTGNLKFEVKPPSEPPLWCRDMGRPLIVAGSTHEGEEEIILRAYKELQREFPGLTMVVAPRHPERFPEVEDLLQRESINYGKRSGLDVEARDVILLDGIGELSSVYAVADISIIGGSFIPRGGHNLFEPAYWRKPIVCGPHMNNFPLAEEFFREGAAIKTAGDALAGVIRELLQNESRRHEMGQRAYMLYERNRGALEKTIGIIEKTIPCEECPETTNP